jgi:hypothetical protein
MIEAKVPRSSSVKTAIATNLPAFGERFSGA